LGLSHEIGFTNTKGEKNNMETSKNKSKTFAIVTIAVLIVYMTLMAMPSQAQVVYQICGWSNSPCPV
jgi:hypothetical protein